MRKWLCGVAAATSAVAFMGAGVAGAESQRDFASGAGTITFDLHAPDRTVVGTETDHFSFTGHAGPLGEDPNGQVTIQIRESALPTVETHFKGDVKEGCVRVDGNRAVVVGKLREPVTFPGFGTVEYAAVFVEDNDHLAGDVPDRAFSVVLLARSAERVCAGIQNLFALMVPLERGNVVVRDRTP